MGAVADRLGVGGVVVDELDGLDVRMLYGARSACDLLLALGIAPESGVRELEALRERLTAELESR